MTNYRQIKSSDNKILEVKKIGIIYNKLHEEALDVVVLLEKVLEKHGFESVRLKIVPDHESNIQQLDENISIAIVVGGDGTFLGAARFYALLDIPLLGINIGRLGFLAQLNPTAIESGIQKFIDGKFVIQERLMLKAFNEDKENEVIFTALNDMVVKGGSVSRTAQLFLYINGKHVCDYIADGLIISTPTGSTAYTLSAGGPVVVAELEAMVIVPICPHSLTTRPIVIPAGEEITVKIEIDTDKVFLTADGQENAELKNTDIIHIQQSDHKAKIILIENEDNGFYCILRQKLHWGVSPVCCF